MVSPINQLLTNSMQAAEQLVSPQQGTSAYLLIDIPHASCPVLGTDSVSLITLGTDLTCCPFGMQLWVLTASMTTGGQLLLWANPPGGTLGDRTTNYPVAEWQTSGGVHGAANALAAYTDMNNNNVGGARGKPPGFNNTTPLMNTRLPAGTQLYLRNPAAANGGQCVFAATTKLALAIAVLT